jgi:predicted ribosome quality control (RQC) complex YloA/Tae2 family protein
MENFALITLAEELRTAVVGMTVRRVSRFPAEVLFLETRSGRMAGLRCSLDPKHPGIWVPERSVAPRAEPDDFLMVVRKHLVNARLTQLRKPLSERLLELEFQTTLPTEELRSVTLVVELVGNAPNLVLLDRSRRILAWARPPSERRGLSLYGEYAPPETRKLPLEAVLGEDTDWFDPDAFTRDPPGWLLRTLAGLGPVLAAEIAIRAPSWSREPAGIAGGLRALVTGLRAPARTAWVYTVRPLGGILESGDLEALGSAVVSPIELRSLRERWSFQTFPGMLAATAAVRDPLEAALLLDRARAPELRRLRRELRRLEGRRERLLERRRRFEEAGELQALARLLAASGEEMDRHHASVTVTEYTDEGPREKTITLDPTRTLRQQVSRMFREQQKARRGLERVNRDLAALEQSAVELRGRERRIRALRHWEEWLAAETGGGKQRKERPAGEPPRDRPRRYRTHVVDGYEILVGRNSRENDELTFRVAAPEDFWLHAADYSGSHVIVRNPAREPDLPDRVLEAAAALAAYHSQARNSRSVEVHFTQRQSVTKPRRARPGLVQIRAYRSVKVEPRGRSEEA